MKKILLTSAVALAVFSACSKMDYEGNDPQGTKVNVRADIKGMNTRLSGGTTWQTNDSIGVSGGNNNINIKRTYSDGAENPWSGSEIYVLGSSDVTFTAYYPFTGDEGTDQGTINFSVIDEKNAYVGDNNVDYMWASATASKSNPTAEFKFTHKMSKISLTFSDGTTTKAGDETAQTVKYTLSNVIVDGKFNTATGEVTAGSTTGKIIVTTAIGETSSLILPSLSSGSTAGSITLTIETGGKAYQGTITPGLGESNEYSYTVDLSSTAQKNAVTVSSSSVTGWTPNDQGKVELKEIEVANTLEVGDFLLADGTVIDKDADITGKSIKGVVFYVGNAQPSTLYKDDYTTSQDILLAETPNATNGLAIAINNAQEDAARFASAKYAITDFFGESGAGSSYADSYITTTLSISNVPSLMLGYNNTQAIMLAQKTVDTDETSTTGFTTFSTLLSTYRTNNTVTGASSWYLPSYAEWKQIQDNYSTINTSIVKAGGTLPQYSDFATTTNGNFYWSSDMRGNSYNWVCPLVETTDVNLHVGRNSNGTTGYFRFAIAF